MTIIFITLAGERVETSDVKEVKRRAANGEITPDTIINVDGTPHLANKIKGLVFGTPANETSSTPSVPSDVAEFFSEQAVEEENTASFAPSPNVSSVASTNINEAKIENQLEQTPEPIYKKVLPKPKSCLEILTCYVFVLAGLSALGGLACLCYSEIEAVQTSGMALILGSAIWAHIHLSILGLVREFLER